MWAPTSPPSLERLLSWHPQPIPVFPVLCLVAAGLYTAGVVRLRRRGDGWPVLRIVCFAAGLLVVLAVTGTAVGGYGMRLFSVHMLQHMVLSMLAPILLLLGAPVTLALRTLPGGRRGARGALLAVLHSRAARILTSPLVTLPLFIASLYGLYFSPIFDAAMSSWWGHALMLGHFLAVGLLFFLPVLSVDPVPHRASHMARMLELVVGLPFHAFFGIAVMMSTHLLFRSFATTPAAWSVSALGDQSTAGGIAWGFSEVPTTIVLVVVAAAWARSSERTARRRDRRADANGDAELAAYNAYLQALDRRA